MTNNSIVAQKKSVTMAKIVEQLKSTPIIQISCERAGISRTTYYRWRQDSKKFAAQCDQSLNEGYQFINDIAEAKLLTSIKDGNLMGIFYWLNHRHDAYKNKLEVTTKISDGKLSPEQEADITKAEKLLMPSCDSGEKRGQNAKNEIK